jgi:hypothetical protein
MALAANERVDNGFVWVVDPVTGARLSLSVTASLTGARMERELLRDADGRPIVVLR